MPGPLSCRAVKDEGEPLLYEEQQVEKTPGKQLFADDYFIESMAGVRRVLRRPRKLTAERPLDIPLDRPWESGQVQFSPIIYDERNRLFRLYYTAWIGDRQLLCALDSEDGVKWERPRLGLVEWDGSTDNNITNCPPAGLTICWDPREREENFRWKRVDNKPTGAGADGEPEWRAFHSRDGYDWHPCPPGTHSAQKMLFNFGSPAETFGGAVDPDAEYVCYSQRGSGRRTRVLGRRDSRDFLNWSGLRTVIDQDLDDPPGTEFYSAAFDSANRTEGGLHILMLHTYLTDVTESYAIEDPQAYWGHGGETGPSALAARVDGLVDTQLAVSRDTMAWRRFRQPFIPRGEPGAWDWGMLFADAPILHEEQLWLFYGACGLTHNGRTAQRGEQPYSTPKSWGKGVAVLRPDGYVGIEAESYAPGVLTTHRFRQESGGSIRVNADAAAGELRYELLEDTGACIPGYGVADCAPIREDTLDGVLSWGSSPGWPAVGDRRKNRCPGLSPSEFYVKLRFHIAPGTTLYSLTLHPPEAAVWGSGRAGKDRVRE